MGVAECKIDQLTQIFTPVCNVDGVITFNDAQCIQSSSGATFTTSCQNGFVKCPSGFPACMANSGRIPICGSKVGLGPPLDGPGCTDQPATSFFPGEAFCTSLGALRVISNSNGKKDLVNTKKNLCHSYRKESRACRADQLVQKCVCPFNLNSPVKPRCTNSSNPVCTSKGRYPVCLNPDNELFCNGKQLICRDTNDGSIDLVDKVFCDR